MVGLQARANEDKPFLGIMLMMLAYFMFSFVDTGMKWMSLLGYSALQLAFMRYLSHFIVSTSLMARDGFSPELLRSDRPFLVIVRGSMLMLSTICNFFALTYLPLTLTATILFSTPIIICILSWPLLGERVGPWRWGAIMFGFCGIIVAIKPFDADFHWAVILSLMSATFFAFYSILTRKLAGVVADATMQFYAGFIGTICLLPFAWLHWQSPATAFEWSIMLGIGVFAFVGHQFLTRAHGLAPANILMPFGYSFIIYLTVWSYVIFDQLPNQWTILGAAMIIVAGLLIWYREKNLALRAARDTSDI